MGRLACLVGWHSWQRHHEPEAEGNGIYFLCRRCRRERTLSRTEGVWRDYS